MSWYLGEDLKDKQLNYETLTWININQIVQNEHFIRYNYDMIFYKCIKFMNDTFIIK